MELPTTTITEVHVEGYEAFRAKVDELAADKTKTVLVLFSGSKDAQGQSWCPDCITAEPVINACLAKVERDDIVLLHVGVGERAEWKDQNNKFRTEAKIRCVPTLVKWGTAEKLEEAQCAKEDMVQLFFEED